MKFIQKSPALSELREKTFVKRGDPIYTFIDWLAYFPAKLFLYTKLTANQVTVIWIIGQLLSSLIALLGTKNHIFLSIFLFQSFFILDCTDGIIARYRKNFTLNGIYLDYVGHYISNPFFFICVGIGVARYTQDIIYIIIGILVGFLFLLNKAITINPLWFSNASQREKVNNFSIVSPHKSVKKAIFVLFRVEYLFNILFWLGLSGFVHYGLILYLFIFLLELGRKMFNQFRQNMRANS